MRLLLRAVLPRSPRLPPHHKEELLQTSNRWLAPFRKRSQEAERKVEAQVPPQAGSQATGRHSDWERHGRADLRGADVQGRKESFGSRAA